MANRHENVEDIMEAGLAKRIKLDEDLQYLYDFERDDTSATELVNQAQQLQVPYYDGDKWDSKYNLLELKELQNFASNIYNNYEKKPGEIELESPCKLLYCVKGTVLDVKSAGLKGFYGELYFNSDKHYLLLAVKGTCCFGNVCSDINNVLMNFQGGEIDSAFSFGEKVRELIMKFKCKPMLMITGHSLGGYLAQIITYALKYGYLDKEGSLKSRDTPCDDFQIYTVVFDSPAALNQIISLDQRNPIRPEILLLPIVNFIKKVNLINSNSTIGSHLGQVVAVDSLQDLNTSKWERFWNIFSSHGINNFQDINIEELRKVKYLPGKNSNKYDAKAIPSCMFSVLNFERLHKYLFLTDMCAELANKLPKFNLSGSHMVIEVETVTIEEFIPRVHHFLSQFKYQLDSGKFDGKQIIDMVAFNLWRVGMLKDAHDLSLNEEWKRKIDQWPDGTKIGGFESHKEMRFVGCLLHNTIPRCFHYNYEDFISLDCDVKDNFLAITKCVLVLIVKDENEINKQPYEKPKQEKIFYLILVDSADNSKLDLLQFCALDTKSQDKLKNKEVEFMGNDVSASLVLGNKLVENLPVLSIYNFHMKSALKDELFYCEQSIASEDRKSRFKSATEFALELSKGKLKFVLISSDAGMGKSTALQQIAKTLQNQLQNYWIVHLNLFSIQNELNEEKEKLISKAEAIEFVRNAALGKRKRDEVLKKVFDWKVEAKEMVLLFDSLDEICPFYRETADILLSLLKETGVQIVLTTRPHEGRNFKEAQIFSVEPLDHRGIRRFVLQKFKMMVKQPPSDISTWLKKISGNDYDDEFWSAPLILIMAINNFDPSEALEAVSDKIQKTNIFETFIDKSISNTLVDKMKHEKSLASGCYSEKFDLYNNLVLILAICTIFHSGEVALDFQDEIEKQSDFINRFDLVKVDDCNKVAFLHRSFAEYLVARLFVKNQQAKSAQQEFLNDNQLKCILFEEEFSDTRKHICTILAMNSPKSTSFSGCIINGEETLLLKILIEEDRYELYMAFKDLFCSQLNTTMMARIHFSNEETSPLYYALYTAREEFVQQLISDGAQFEAILYNEDVLHLAIGKGLHKEVMNHFESLKSNINEIFHGYTPLHRAVKNGSREMVTFLIEKGADVNYEDGIFKRSALYYAIEANSVEIVELLIAKEADLAEALTWAAELNRKEIFDIIYEKYTPSAYKVERLRKSLFKAVCYGHLELFKHLCDFPEANPREVNEDGDTFLHVAAVNGHLHCIDFIFEYQQQSVDVRNDAEETPLMKACFEDAGNIETVEWLLKKNAKYSADVNVKDSDGNTCLHIASQNNQLKNGSINSGNQKGQTPLHFAANEGNAEIVDILINAGADINWKDKEGWTPLFYALDGFVYIDVVKSLLKNSADVNVKDNDGNTCLHIASQNNQLKIVKLLLKNGSINSENQKGQTPLHFAANEGNAEIVDILINAGADINWRNEKGLYAFGEDPDNTATVKCLLKHSPHVNLSDNFGNMSLHNVSACGENEAVERQGDQSYPLNFAKKNREEFTQQLISDGAKFNWETILLEKYGLHLAIEKGLYKEVMNNFKIFKSNINEKRNYSPQTPLQIAVKNGSREMVEFLIEQGADINVESINSFSALIYAIEANNVELVEFLIAKDADTTEAIEWAAILNRKEMIDIIYEKFTPSEFKVERIRKCLSIAVYYGHLEIIKQLSHFPEASQREVKEICDSFLHIAAQKGHLNCMQFIFEYQQQPVDVRDEIGWTSLMKACWNGNVEIVEWLLEKNADVNAVDDDGISCMHLAAQRENIHTVEILLKAGAEINLKDKKGRTAIFYASNEVMVEYLIENSADINLRDNEGNTCLHF